MSLAPGARLGTYEITDRLGAGGMGEVYRATDSILGRDVAIKVLPDAFAQDVERLARFEREARTLASLNHPNIAIVFGFERLHPADDAHPARALVMELVDGPTLADLIAQGPVPIDEALPIARQIAEALEAAHEHGIIHRDLKPANVKLSADGRVKVLDFGLAKALEPAAATSSMASLSPTITTPAMTQAGVLLGTAAYMSPEQARGKPVDRRADIWAFGCVLFEMLSGRRTVADDETVSDTLASVLKGEPLWNALPADTPPRIRTLIERCLRKDLRRRLPDIAEARIQLDEAAIDPPVASQPAATASSRGYAWPAVSVVSLLVAAALASWIALAPVSVTPLLRFEIPAPPGAAAQTSDGRLVDTASGISPDGRTVAFVATVAGRPQLWIRPLDSGARPLVGTEDALRAAWSPDSRQIAFFAQGLLKRVAVTGGPPTPVCKLDARDIDWGSDNVILVGGGGKALSRVSPDTCDPQPATQLGSGESTHDYPEFLPDGRHFLYMARHGIDQEDWDIYAGDLDSTERVRVPGIHSGVRYSPTGHLLFTRDGVLMAQPFDAERLQLTGDATPVAEGLGGPSPFFSVSENGSLAYTTIPSALTSQLIWFDRGGRQIRTVGAPGEYRRIDLSPDDRLLAFDRGLDVFVFDIERGSTRRLVSTEAADFAAVWSPTPAVLAFASSRDPAGNAGPSNPAAGNLYRRTVDIVEPDELLLKTDAGKIPSDWSRDGYLAYTSRGGEIWALQVPVSSNTSPIRVTNTDFQENDARFSPDARWIAYESNESGTPTDIYIQSFPERGAKQVISTGGGSAPRWARDGSALFYIAPDRTVMSVSIAPAGGAVRAGAPRPVFQLPAFEGAADYDVASDGRFLVNVPAAKQTSTGLTVIYHWGLSLKQP